MIISIIFDRVHTFLKSFEYSEPCCIGSGFIYSVALTCLINNLCMYLSLLIGLPADIIRGCHLKRGQKKAQFQEDSCWVYGVDKNW